jgi:hypothetical protein
MYFTVSSATDFYSLFFLYHAFLSDPAPARPIEANGRRQRLSKRQFAASQQACVGGLCYPLLFSSWRVFVIEQ